MSIALLIILILSLLTGCAPVGAATDATGLLAGNGDEVYQISFDGEPVRYLDSTGTWATDTNWHFNIQHVMTATTPASR